MDGGNRNNINFLFLGLLDGAAKNNNKKRQKKVQELDYTAAISRPCDSQSNIYLAVFASVALYIMCLFSPLNNNVGSPLTVTVY